MSKCIEFRTSMTGGCTRQLVAAHLDPDALRPPAERKAFLSDGHLHQEGVTRWLNEQGIEPAGIEAEGLLIAQDESYAVRGHVDGILTGDETSLLEVKAVKTANFFKLAESEDWRAEYGGYVLPAQSYMSLPVFVGADDQPDAGIEYEGPIPVTYFLFKDRDSSDMLGGLPLEAPSYTYRPDMVEPAQPALFQQVEEKLLRAAEHVRAGRLPEQCDKVGWCFFCQQYGAGTPDKPRGGRQIALEADDPEVADLVDAIRDYERLKAMSKQLNDTKKFIQELTAKLDPAADAFLIDFGEEGLVTVKMAEVRQLVPDTATVKEFVSAGQIPRTEREYKRMTISRKAS